MHFDGPWQYRSVTSHQVAVLEKALQDGWEPFAVTAHSSGSSQLIHLKKREREYVNTGPV